MDKQEILHAYELMVLSRLFDSKMLALQRQGRLGTFASSQGHEAIQVGSVMALKKDDWVAPYFRQWPAFIALGYPMEMLLQYNSGDERGMLIPKGINVLPVNIPVSSQIPHAVGLAWGFKKKGQKKVVVCFLGDGATSKGDFHEALNFAGVFKVPVILICENNQYAISVPLKRQTASKTIAQKADAYGIEGMRIDGNNVEEIYEAVIKAREIALQGKPVLIEAVTYRLSDHTTADDASRYRSKSEVEEARKKDWRIILKNKIINEGFWNESKEKQLIKKLELLIEKAVKKFESIKPVDPMDIFNYTFNEMTYQLKRQSETFKRFYPNG
ncbi:pyruvate dehydrogenase (acetyl-transferring) E1 component subunit alpha [Candidatus Pacearchaeota archaeon]|nr:pyruvate dehydrogenase (acetyl-transferring) E1 component subunit alpha [Candidatus Pacearchaeota archaeon]